MFMYAYITPPVSCIHVTYGLSLNGKFTVKMKSPHSYIAHSYDS